MFTALFALLLGLGVAYAGWTYVALARRMRHFRSTPGVVVARSVVVVPGGSTTTGAFGEGGGYMPAVGYRYTVDGVELSGDRISFAFSGYKHAVAERKLAEIPEHVVVWYDPAKPSDAFLKKHTATYGVLFMILGVLVALGALIGVVVKATG